jgi:hypothetical protein
MKCNECLILIEQYIDGEAPERDAEQVSAHLITCADCAREFEALTGEQEVYARYDRELEIPPSMWGAIAARTAVEDSAIGARSRSGSRQWLAGLFTLPRFGFAFSSAMAVLIVAVAVGIIYLRNHKEQNPPVIVRTNNVNPLSPPIKTTQVTNPEAIEIDKPLIPPRANPANSSKVNQPVRRKSVAGDQGGVLFTDAAYTDIEDRDTASHLEQAQNLLLSIRNIKSDDDEEIDVTYEKSESRRLLNENIVLRRDAEMAGKFPAKSVLGSLEPFLIDIANLPDKAPAPDVRQIKERVQKTEIVAELRGY